jgi:hypothetical protein
MSQMIGTIYNNKEKKVSTTIQNATQPEINIGDAHPSRITQPWRSYFWKTSITNKRKTTNWVRKLNRSYSKPSKARS